MKKTFLKSDWQKMEISAQPTAARAMVRIDAHGTKWEWVGGRQEGGSEGGSGMKRWRLTRVTKTHVWIIPMAYGHMPPRGSSRRISSETFHREWLRLPQKEAMKKSDYLRACQQVVATGDAKHPLQIVHAEPPGFLA